MKPLLLSLLQYTELGPDARCGGIVEPPNVLWLIVFLAVLELFRGRREEHDCRKQRMHRIRVWELLRQVCEVTEARSCVSSRTSNYQHFLMGIDCWGSAVSEKEVWVELSASRSVCDLLWSRTVLFTLQIKENSRQEIPRSAVTASQAPGTSFFQPAGSKGQPICSGELPLSASQSPTSLPFEIICCYRYINVWYPHTWPVSVEPMKCVRLVLTWLVLCTAVRSCSQTHKKHFCWCAWTHSFEG